MNRREAGLLVLLVCVILGLAACGPAPIQPISFPDPDVSCPAGLISWKLDVVDSRAEPEASEKMIGRIREGVQGSFAGCKWVRDATDVPTITITVYRLGVSEYNRYQEAAAEWHVSATNPSGSTLTEFDANEEESRPAYSGADAEALNEAYRKALQRTIKGLAAMQRLGSARPPEGTFVARSATHGTGPQASLSR